MNCNFLDHFKEANEYCEACFNINYFALIVSVIKFP